MADRNNVQGFDTLGNRRIGKPQSFGPGWEQALIGYFQFVTGLGDLEFSVSYRSDFGNNSVPPTGGGGQGFSIGGGGNAVAQNIGQGGVILVTGPTAIGGFADWGAGGSAGNFQTLGSPQEPKLSMVAGRISFARAPSAATQLCLGVFGSPIFYGVGAAGAATKLQYVRGPVGAIATIVESDKVINVDPTGEVLADWITFAFFPCFDLFNVGANFDVQGSAFAMPTILEPVANVPNSKIAPYWFNEGVQLVGATDDYRVSDIVVCAQF